MQIFFMTGLWNISLNLYPHEGKADLDPNEIPHNKPDPDPQPFSMKICR